MVSENKPVVSWGKRAYNSLNKAHKHISETSIANADMVKERVLAITRSLPENPERYPPDRFKNENPGNYRAFEAYSYRIAYRHTDKVIKILRVRHVKQEPKLY